MNITHLILMMKIVSDYPEAVELYKVFLAEMVLSLMSSLVEYEETSNIFCSHRRFWDSFLPSNGGFMDLSDRIVYFVCLQALLFVSDLSWWR